jgi:hypothetical protein
MVVPQCVQVNTCEIAFSFAMRIDRDQVIATPQALQIGISFSPSDRLRRSIARRPLAGTIALADNREHRRTSIRRYRVAFAPLGPAPSSAPIGPDWFHEIELKSSTTARLERDVVTPAGVISCRPDWSPCRLSNAFFGPQLTILLSATNRSAKNLLEINGSKRPIAVGAAMRLLCALSFLCDRRLALLLPLRILGRSRFIARRFIHRVGRRMRLNVRFSSGDRLSGLTGRWTRASVLRLIIAGTGVRYARAQNHCDTSSEKHLLADHVSSPFEIPFF